MRMQAKIRWGVLGTANIAIKRFIPGVRASSNGVVSAIAARERVRAEAIATQLEIPHAYGSYDALLADPEIDAIYIPLPNAMHAEWPRDAGSPCSARSRSRSTRSKRSTPPMNVRASVCRLWKRSCIGFIRSTRACAS
jgi:hypothetical protein